MSGDAMTRNWIAQADGWFFTPAPARRLAIFRVLVALFSLAYLLVRLPVFLSMGDSDAHMWQPVGVLWWLNRPLDAGLVQLMVVATVLLAGLCVLGVAHRVVGPLFALGLLSITTYRSSFGQLLWFENLMVLHALIVAVAPAADALRLGRIRPAPPADDPRYGWPLRLAAVVTVVTYALAGVAKLRIGGIGWIGGESLRNHVAFSAARLRVLGGTPSPVAAPLMGTTWVFTPLAVATLVIELGAPVVLFVKQLRWPWVAAVWSMHAAIAATMFVLFPYPLALVAFAPLFELERLVQVSRWVGVGAARPAHTEEHDELS
jgi:hypothetical protein